MNIGPGSFCSRSLQKRPGGQYSPVWPLRSVNMSLVSLLTWSVPTQNFQRNRENDHCLTNKAFKIFEIWIGNGWFHMIGTQQQDHKTRLPFPSSVCYGPHPTSHVVFSLLSCLFSVYSRRSAFVRKAFNRSVTRSHVYSSIMYSILNQQIDSRCIYRWI